MNILTAINHKGIQATGVGETTRECLSAMLHSVSRSDCESCEAEDLLAWAKSLAELEPSLPDCVLDRFHSDTEFWRITAR